MQRVGLHLARAQECSSNKGCTPVPTLLRVSGTEEPVPRRACFFESLGSMMACREILRSSDSYDPTHEFRATASTSERPSAVPLCVHHINTFDMSHHDRCLSVTLSATALSVRNSKKCDALA
jgi:hypothetical protein